MQRCVANGSGRAIIWRWKTLALVLAAAYLAISASPAVAATDLVVLGSAECTNGRDVVGVYIKSDAGGSGFAPFTHYPGRKRIAYFKRTVKTTSTNSVRIDVGCGRTSQSWGSNNKTKAYRVGSKSSVELNVLCPEPANGTNGTTSSGSCRFPKTGSYTYAEIAFDKTQCTWYAAHLWKSATGSAPRFLKPGDANAHRWDDHASSNGWDVRGYPRPRSIMVWQPYTTSSTNKYGHVAWVHDVRIRTDSKGAKYVEVRISDRNFDWKGTTRTKEWVKFNPSLGTRFILAPRPT